MIEFIAAGPGAKQRWSRPLPAGREIRLGRAPKQGWAVPWDLRISREHADLFLEGDRLRVRCLETARNSMYLREEAFREFIIGPGEEFRIGHTIFRLVAHKADSDVDPNAPPVHPVRGVRPLEELAHQPLEARLQALLKHLDERLDGHDAADGNAASSDLRDRDLQREAHELRAEVEAIRDMLDQTTPQVDASDADPGQGATAASPAAAPEADPQGDATRDQTSRSNADATPAASGATKRPSKRSPGQSTDLGERQSSTRAADGPDRAPAKRTPPPLPERQGPAKSAPSGVTPSEVPSEAAARAKDSAAANVSPRPANIPMAGAPGFVESNLGIQRQAADAHDFTGNPDEIALAFNNYEIIDQIARGGTGQILKARHRYTDNLAAIKLLATEASQSEELTARFRLRCKILTNSRHANIVAAYDAGRLENMHYLIMEYCGGPSVVEMLKGRQLDVDEALQIVIQAGRALDDAHQRGIVHRNVHPGHLLTDQNGAVKLTGWDLALHIQEEFLQSFEKPGRILGIVDYISPEQIADSRQVDGRSDVFSLGCTLFAILTKRVLYPIDWLQRKVTAQRYQPAPVLQELRPDVSPQLEAVYQKMLAKDRKERYQNMQQAIEALQACQGSAEHFPS